MQYIFLLLTALFAIGFFICRPPQYRLGKIEDIDFGKVKRIVGRKTPPPGMILASDIKKNWSWITAVNPRTLPIQFRMGFEKFRDGGPNDIVVDKYAFEDIFAVIKRAPGLYTATSKTPFDYLLCFESDNDKAVCLPCVIYNGTIYGANWTSVELYGLLAKTNMLPKQKYDKSNWPEGKPSEFYDIIKWDGENTDITDIGLFPMNIIWFKNKQSGWPVPYKSFSTPDEIKKILILAQNPEANEPKVSSKPDNQMYMFYYKRYIPYFDSIAPCLILFDFDVNDGMFTGPRGSSKELGKLLLEKEPSGLEEYVFPLGSGPGVYGAPDNESPASRHQEGDANATKPARDGN
jgi:hypothetical protein